MAALLSLTARAVMAGALETFQSPTGNIHCLISDGPQPTPIASCEVRQYAGPVPPRPADCELDWVAGASIDAKGHVRLFSCQGDTNVDHGNKTLAYGSAITHGGVTCSASPAGVVCKAKSGRGFLVSRAAIKKLPGADAD
jgi:hypothetical protein